MRGDGRLGGFLGACKKGFLFWGFLALVNGDIGLGVFLRASERGFMPWDFLES